MLGKRFFTAALTFLCSAGVPFCATLASAFRAWALSGIGYFRDPPEFLQPGDEVTIEADGIGRLTNPVVAGW